MLVRQFPDAEVDKESFGSRTEEAVRKLQTSKRIKVVVGETTRPICTSCAKHSPLGVNSLLAAVSACLKMVSLASIKSTKALG